MSLVKTLLVIGIVLTGAAGLHWHPWLVCAIEAFLSFAAAALPWAVGI